MPQAGERRKHRRAGLVTSAGCNTQGREHIQESRNVSVGGLLLAPLTSLRPGTTVTVSFRLETSDPPLVFCRGNVVFSRKGVGTGIRFAELSEETLRALEKYVAVTN